MTTITIGNGTLQYENGRRVPPPVTLPAVTVRTLNDEAAEQVAHRVQIKVIRAGLDAWRLIEKTGNSFENWKLVGLALLVGKNVALRSTGVNQAWGAAYSRAFSRWVVRQGFDHLPASTRSVCVELAENAEAITAWRDSLPERQRKRLIHPLSVTRRWKLATAHGDGKCPQDWKREATAAWKRFAFCIEKLSAADAEPLLETARAEIRA